MSVPSGSARPGPDPGDGAPRAGAQVFASPGAARASTRLRLARTAWIAAWTAAAAAVIIAASGGAVVGAGAFRLSARSPVPALSLALAAAAMAIAADPGRSRLRALGAALEAVSRRETLVVALVAVATAAAGMRLGTRTAGGADSAGYLGQAARWREGTLRVEDPWIARSPWPAAAATWCPLGSSPAPDGRALVPRYPPGLPLLFAAAETAAGRRAVWAVVPALGGLLVAAAAWLAARLGGPPSGLVAASMAASSATFFFHLVQPMSDVPAAAAWTLGAALAMRGTTAGAGCAGLAAGVAVAIRPNLAPLLAPLAWLAACEGAREQPARRRWRPAAAAACVAGALPAIAFVALLNVRLYGGPFSSGYGTVGQLFAVSNAALTLPRYASWLADREPFVLVMAGLVLAAAYGPGGALRRFARVTLAVAALVLGAYAFYAPFESPTYLRFLLPAFPFLTAAGSAMAWRMAQALPPAARAAGVVAATLAAPAWGLTTARDMGVFGRLQAAERRYVRVAEAVGTIAGGARPVVVAGQHSGSLAYYTGASTLRWDELPQGGASLARAIALVEAAGGRLAVVLDESEEEPFRRRFAGHPAGMLDWAPRAETIAAPRARVWLIDDRPRYFRGERYPTMRLGDPLSR